MKLSWFAKKLCWLKRRFSQIKRDDIQPSKWHKACLWLARSVGGINMLLQDDGTVIVISKSSFNPGSLENGAISKSKYGSIRSYLRVIMIGEDSRKFEFKTVDAWSEDLAKFVATIVSLTPPDLKLNSPEKWGVMVFNSTSVGGRSLKTEVLFPTFKNEEELFVRMALDGFALDENEA